MLLFVVGSGRAEQNSRSVAKPDTIPVSQVKLKKASVDHILGTIPESNAQVTLVNVWATWCQPCREEFPAILQVYRELKEEGFRLIFISADFPEQEKQARRFLANHGVDFQTYMKTDKDQQFINALHPDWSGALPGTFIYDDSGELLRYWEGRAEYSRFKQAVQNVVTK